MIRVVIVDDHALVRSGLRLLLEAEEDITVEDEGGTAPQSCHMPIEIGLHGIVRHCQRRCGTSDNGLSSQRRPGMRQSG